MAALIEAKHPHNESPISRKGFLMLAATAGGAYLYLKYVDAQPKTYDFTHLANIQEGLDNFGDIEAQKIASNVYNLELNGHAIERRGKELAGYIWTVVDAAFNHPQDNNPFDKAKKAIRCAGEEVVAGCSQAVQYLVEVESRTIPGAMRVASVIFGLDKKTGQWRTITALYKAGSLEEVSRKPASNKINGECGDNLPPTGFIFAAP